MVNKMIKNSEKVTAFWNAFLSEAQLDANTTYHEAFYFGADKELANSLLALVLSGVKTATTSAVPCYEAEGEPMPQPGDYSIVTDWDGTPYCVIRTTQTTILPFNEMTYDICKREGEDTCLETWIEGHRRFLSQDAKMCGYVFSEDMPVLFEDFEVVYKK